MVRSTDSLEAQLLNLPPADRARLAEVLLASLDADVARGPSTDVEALWRAEGERRLQELASGRVAGIPAEQIFANIGRR